MALTPDQETYLAALADKGIADEAEIAARNQQVAVDMQVQSARDAKQAELAAQAQALIDKGMQDFETQVVPTITADVTPTDVAS